MSRFISNKTKKIQLSDTEFVEIRAEIGYEQILPIMSMQKDNKSEMEMIVPLLIMAIVSWNFTEENGEVAKVSEENIRRLNMETLRVLSEEVTAQYFPSKKD